LRFAIHTQSLTNDVVIPGAKQQQISATASVPAAASVSATVDHAAVLVFINQTMIVGTGAPTDSASAVRVTMDKIGGHWLVSASTPSGEATVCTTTTPWDAPTEDCAGRAYADFGVVRCPSWTGMPGSGVHAMRSDSQSVGVPGAPMTTEAMQRASKRRAAPSAEHHGAKQSSNDKLEYRYPDYATLDMQQRGSHAITSLLSVGASVPRATI